MCALNIISGILEPSHAGETADDSRCVKHNSQR